MDSRMKRSLDGIFYPRSIAVIGASNNPKTWGQRTLKDILAGGFRGPVYPIHPKDEIIQGLPAFRGLADVPGDIDLAVIVVNAGLAPDMIQACIDRGVKGGILISAGFAEVSEDGAEQQRRIARLARESGFYFIGPNCLGVFSAIGRVNTMYHARSPQPPTGPISFISQSGTLGMYFYESARKNGFGMDKFISCGNQAAVHFTDLLEYLGEDPHTRVITGYMEDVGDGRRFVEAARRVTAQKPVVLYKAGATEASARAARSHTAAMASNDEVFEAACRQAGVIRMDDVMEMFDLVEALCYQPLPRGNRVAIISDGGGFNVTSAQACTRMGLELPLLSDETQAAIRGHMLPYGPPPLNPVDCIAIKPGDAYNQVIEIVAARDDIDGLIVMPLLPVYQRGTPVSEMIDGLKYAERLAMVPEKFGKPLILFSMEEWVSEVSMEIFKSRNVPSFADPEDCARAMYGLVRYAEVRRRSA